MFEVKARSNFCANQTEYLYDSMKQKNYCDAYFFVRSRSYYVHMLVLSAHSEFFVKNQYKLSAIFSPFEFDVIDAILKYCYTGDINDHHYEKFIELANLLEVKISPQYKTVNLSNCLEILIRSDDPELKIKAMDLTLDNFETLHKTQDFLSLPASTVIEILKSTDLIIPSEEDVFNSVKLWVNYDDANRKNYLIKLISSVRLSLLPTAFLIKDVLKFCNSCAECVTYLGQAILAQNDKNLIQREIHRTKREKIALVGGDTQNVSFICGKSIDIYDGKKKSWTLSNNIVNEICRFASVIVEDAIVIIGGLDSESKTLTSVEYINLKNGQKRKLRPLNHARRYLSAVTIRRDSSTDVYVIGGHGKEKLSSVERWNSKTEDWKIIASLLLRVDCHSASVIEDRIYVTGGRVIGPLKNEISVKNVQMYSSKNNSWINRAQMIQERHDHSSVVFKGELFVAGGIDQKSGINLYSVERYNPKADLWTPFHELPKPASGISLCCFQNQMCCMGGFDGNKLLSSFWKYDETSNSWKASTSLSVARSYAVAHVVPYDSINYNNQL